MAVRHAAIPLVLALGASLGTVALPTAAGALGTTDVVQLVADVNPGPSDGAPGPVDLGDIAAFGGHVYFAADDGVHGLELWRSDGVTTTMVADIAPGAASSEPDSFAVLGNHLYFRTVGLDFHLWRTDGIGATLVKDVFVADGSLTPFAGKLFFSGRDGVNGSELWSTDGSTTAMVKDISSGAGDSFPDDFTAVGNRLYFSADDAVTGRELWRTDGTAVGTVQAADLDAGAGDGVPTELTAFAGQLFFSADPGPSRRLMRFDGATASDVLETVGGAVIESPEELTATPGGLYFNAPGIGGDREPWLSDGSTGHEVKDLNPTGNSSPRNFTALGGAVYFRASDGFAASGTELWRTDGTAAGTSRVADIAAGSPGSSPDDLVAFDGSVVFSADDDLHGRELWVTDGTTTRQHDVLPGSTGSRPGGFAQLGSSLYFIADDGTHGYELHRLTTPPPPPVPPVTTPPAPTDTGVRIAFKGKVKRLHLNRKGKVTVRLRCPATEQSGPCAGKLSLRTKAKIKVKPHQRKHRVTLATRRFTIPAGTTGTVKLKLSKKDRRVAKKHPRAVLRAKVHDQAGNHKTLNRTTKVVVRKRR